MANDDIRRRIADLEVERHKSELLYADRQELKRGGHGAVIARLRRRKYVGLCVFLPLAALLVIFGDTMNRVLAVPLVVNAVHQYTQLKRTEDILACLAAEAGDGGAA